MKQIKRVPAEEFAEHAADYLEGPDTVSVERDGKVIGQYVPAPNGHTSNGTGPVGGRRKDNPEAREHYERLKRTLQAIRERNGMTEDEFADLFDLTKPFPYDLDPRS